MMRPQRCFSIEPIACWVHKYAEVRLVLSTASQSGRFMRITNWSRVMPALFTRISILPNSAITALNAALTWSSFSTSAGKARAWTLTPATLFFSISEATSSNFC